MSKFFDYLRKNGPSPSKEVPKSPTKKDRMRGVTKFVIHTSVKGGCKGRGRQSVVYYIMGKHDKKEVVKKYLDVNDQLLDMDKKHLISLISRNGRSWKKPAREAYSEVTKP